jgi:hypothetical protein
MHNVFQMPLFVGSGIFADTIDRRNSFSWKIRLENKCISNTKILHTDMNVAYDLETRSSDLAFHKNIQLL